MKRGGAARILISLSTAMARAATEMQWEQVHKLRIRRVRQPFGHFRPPRGNRKCTSEKREETEIFITKILSNF